MIAEKARVIAEGAEPSAADELTGKAGRAPLFRISGGNIDLKKFDEIVGSGER